MDITKCYNTDCPQKESCFRFTAPPAEWQSFAHFEPNETTGRCEHYWEVKEVGEKKEGVSEK
jgi:hypothetical protein